MSRLPTNSGGNGSSALPGSRVVWTEGARRELDAAIAFVADESLEGAISLLEDILNSTDSLQSMPDRGRVVPELDDPTVRELLVGPYRLLYHVAESDVHILSVLHQRRDFDRSHRLDG